MKQINLARIREPVSKVQEVVQKQQQWLYLALQGAFSLFLAVALIQSDFLNLDYIEFFSYDLRVRLRPTPPISDRVRLVSVDKASVQSLGRTPSISDHIQLLEEFKKAPPRVLVYAFNPNNLAGTQTQFQRFAAITKEFPFFVVAVNDVAPMEEQHKLRLKPPLQAVRTLSGPKTFDRKIFAKDDVTRRMLTAFQDQPTLHVEVAKLFEPRWTSETEIRGNFEFLDSRQVFINFHPEGTYPRHSFARILSDSALRTSWQDKIVVVGLDTGETSEEYIRSPYSRSVLAMPMLEVHANMFDTVLLDAAPLRAPRWLDLFITALIAFFTVRVSLILRPLRGMAILGLSVIGFCLSTYLLFVIFNFWVAIAQPLLAFFISYYFFIPYRLIMENRRSWEYYQKNKLLVQVEELKNNFISMMSHDLKTPLARIQGMTEVISNDVNPLSHQQADALITIRQSSDELLNFITSILDLGRIESSELQINKVSKDVNTLLNDVIRSLEYIARAKRISIITEFEPLFSIPMDPDLMRQVFLNLIENAIKYSPEGSRVLVTTDEAPGSVVIQIADQGPGIPTEELPHIFLKFYRSKNVRSSQIKGSGLGLYLAKYFVELHRGSVIVDSQIGQGTTFTVELPTI
jgi:signal transduction histidine kinase